MIIEIPDQVISQSGLSSKEILLKVALMLFQEERLTPLTGEQISRTSSGASFKKSWQNAR